MPTVSAEILRWARETAGLSVEDAVEKLGIKDAHGVLASDRLHALERGDAEVEVSRPMLVKMARSYRRPLLTFYLDQRPPRGDRGQDFRNLPDRSTRSEALVDALVRDVKARQSMVRAVLLEEEEARPLPWVGSAQMESGVGHVLACIRQQLAVDLAEYRAQPSPEAAFAFLRGRVESVGVYVLLIGNLGSRHTEISVEAFRGFALADPIAPFIVINDQDARPAWSFTLLHELAHLWLGATGVSGASAEVRIERFCNDVAADFLLPAHELGAVGLRDEAGDDETARQIADFAAMRHLSRSMVAYRLYREGRISEPLWRRLIERFRQQWLASRADRQERQGGPDYYVVRRHRLGLGLLQFAARHLSGGALTPTKAGKVLGVKPRSVEPLLSTAALGGRAA
jgi:Zn-dependent peptidase ImmA (M78 family)/transcriptional regulator with XRE-family HTH domain